MNTDYDALIRGAQKNLDTVLAEGKAKKSEVIQVAQVLTLMAIAGRLNDIATELQFANQQRAT